MVNLNWGEIFGRVATTGISDLGKVAVTTDANVKAESKASAEAFAEANEQYTNEVQDNKKALSKEVDSISDLVGGDVGKIRTIMRTYGNADVVSQLQKDFAEYQQSAVFDKAREGKEIKFKSLKEYINGKLTKTGTALISDEAAEQAQDETSIAGDELDIQQAEKKAKGMGVSLEQYLNTQARKLSSRPAFSVEGKAARLVEESKVGIFGKTLTMEEARNMVTGGQKLGGAEDESELGDTGFAMERDGGIGSRDLAKILSEANELNVSSGKVNTEAELRPLRNDIIGNLPDKLTTLIGDGTTNRKIKNINSDSVTAVIAAIDTKLKATKDRKTIGMLNQLKEEFLGKADAPKEKLNEEDQIKKNNGKELQSLTKPNIDTLKKLQKEGHLYFKSPNGLLVPIQKQIDMISNKTKTEKKVIEKQPKSDKFVLPSQKELNKYPKG